MKTDLSNLIEYAAWQKYRSYEPGRIKMEQVLKAYMKTFDESVPHVSEIMRKEYLWKISQKYKCRPNFEVEILDGTQMS